MLPLQIGIWVSGTQGIKTEIAYQNNKVLYIYTVYLLGTNIFTIFQLAKVVKKGELLKDKSDVVVTLIRKTYILGSDWVARGR